MPAVDALDLHGRRLPQQVRLEQQSLRLGAQTPLEPAIDPLDICKARQEAMEPTGLGSAIERDSLHPLIGQRGSQWNDLSTDDKSSRMILEHHLL